MKSGITLVIVGVCMFTAGLILFYFIEVTEDKILENIRNMGTFVGLSGMGVTLAGILIYLINKNTEPIKENYDI
tara:strand:+ start:33 stop:254 length:222 start_codon:yes stop_codon:yes gene_type:complete